MGEEAARLRELYERWNRGELEAVIASFHPEVEFRTSGIFPDMPPVYHGHEGIRRFWRDFYEMWESIAIEVDEITRAGALVVALWHYDGRARGGLPVTRPGAHTAAFREGLIRELRSFASWEDALAWAREATGRGGT